MESYDDDDDGDRRVVIVVVVIDENYRFKHVVIQIFIILVPT